MGICTLSKGERRVLLKHIMDYAGSASRGSPSHTMQPLIYEGVNHLQRDNIMVRRYHHTQATLSALPLAFASSALTQPRKYMVNTDIFNRAEGILLHRLRQHSRARAAAEKARAYMHW